MTPADAMKEVQLVKQQVSMRMHVWVCKQLNLGVHFFSCMKTIYVNSCLLLLQNGDGLGTMRMGSQDEVRKGEMEGESLTVHATVYTLGFRVFITMFVFRLHLFEINKLFSWALHTFYSIPSWSLHIIIIISTLGSCAPYASDKLYLLSCFCQDTWTVWLHS